jgi:hypothetical protein
MAQGEEGADEHLNSFETGAFGVLFTVRNHNRH